MARREASFNVLVIYDSPLGKELVRKLSEKHNVIVVGEKRELCEALLEVADVDVIVGNILSMEFYEENNISFENFDIVLVLSDDDMKNVFLATLAKQLGGEKVRVITVLREPRFGKILNRFGIDYINVSSIIASFIMPYIFRDVLLTPIIESFRESHTEIAITGVLIEKDSRFVGKRLGTIPLPESVIVVGVLHRDPATNTMSLISSKEAETVTLQEGDIVILIGFKRDLESVVKMFSAKRVSQ